MAKIIIIGGGLTGLSAAYHLEKRGFFDYKIVERDTTVGGLCRSVHQDGFTFDYTGHLLHINDPHFQEFIKDIVGFDQFNTIYRRSFIYSQDAFTKYPFQINMRGLPVKTIAECIEGYILRKKSRKKNMSFVDYVYENFGAGFAKYFFIPYQSKIFGYDINKITASWMGRFVPQTSLEQMLEGALYSQPEEEQKIGYNAQFFYPKQGGIFFWVEKLAQALKNPIETNRTVTSIDMAAKRITYADGSDDTYEQLITTMPLDTLLHKTKAAPSINFTAAKRNLVCNSVLNFNLGFNRKVSEKHWIYFPESEYPFYRLGFPNNFAESMAPEGCSSMYGEFSYVGKSKEYVSKQLKASLKATKDLLKVTDHDIITEKIITISHAYVIYDFWREKNLPKLHSTLESYNIYSVGRYGEWKYASMQEGYLDGKKIAERLTIMPAQSTYHADQKQSNNKQKEI